MAPLKKSIRIKKIVMRIVMRDQKQRILTRLGAAQPTRADRMVIT